MLFLPSPIKLSLYNTIALLSLSPSFFYHILPNSSHLLSSSFVMPTCSGPHHGLFLFQSCFRRLSTCNETQSYTIQPRRGIPALPIVDDYPPLSLFVPPRHFHFNEYHAISTDRYDIQLRGQLPPPSTYYVS